MYRIILLLLLLTACSLNVNVEGNAGTTVAESATEEATEEATLTPTATRTPTATATFTQTPTHTLTRTWTPTPTFTQTPTWTVTRTPTATRTPTPTFTALPTFTAVPAPAVFDVVNLVWFYKPPNNLATQLLTPIYDTYVLTKNDEIAREIIKGNGDTAITQYLRWEAIHDPSDCARRAAGCNCQAPVWGNSVGYRPGDVCFIRDNHPDWFLRSFSGGIMRTGDGFVLMDPAATGWREWFLLRTIEMQTLFGWHGVFLDNLTVSRVQFNGTLRDYSSDASLQQANLAMLCYIYNAYFLPQGRPLYANVVRVNETSAAAWHSYLTCMDGAMDEGWAVDWGTGYVGASAWREHLERAEQTQRDGNLAFLISQGSTTTIDRQRFAFASYLLISNGLATFRYTDASAYTQHWHFDTYAQAQRLGQPLGPRTLMADGVTWERRFQFGVVRVNPVSHTSSITVNP